MAESVTMSLRNMLTSYQAVNRANPEKIALGKEVAERLWLESMVLVRPSPTLREFLDSIEAGTAFLCGVRLEAGWPHG